MKAASVFPDPVGAAITTSSPARMAGQPRTCGSVGTPNARGEPLAHERMEIVEHAPRLTSTRTRLAAPGMAPKIGIACGALLFAVLVLAARGAPARRMPVLQLARHGANRRSRGAGDLARRNARRADRDRPGHRATPKYVNSLVLVDTRNGPQAAHWCAARDVAVPRWSPDGRGLAYLARAGRRAFRQLFVRSPSGATRAADARAGRGHRCGVESRRTARSRSSRPTARLRPPYFFAGDNDYTATALTPPDHLWIVSAAGGARAAPHQRLVDDRADRSGRHLLAADRLDARRTAHHRSRASRTRSAATTSARRSGRSTLRRGAMRKLTASSRARAQPGVLAPTAQRLAYWYPLNGDFNSENTLRVPDDGRDRRSRRASRSQHCRLAVVSRRAPAC